jgi:predicted nucleic acid-binding protein
MIVVDASVLFAAAIRDGSTRHELLNTSRTLIAPPALWEEVQARQDRIVHFSKLTAEEVGSLLDALRTRITTVPAAWYAHKRPIAQAACKAAQAWGDDEYVALALALDAPVWTLDQDFARVEGVRVVATAEVDDGA